MSTGSRPSVTTLSKERYKTFEEFYPFYLSQHSNRTCRRLHVVGTLLGLVTLVYLLVTLNFTKLWLPFVIGYSFAWVGHFVFEKNKPATFKYPLFSLRGDFVMLRQVLTGQVPF